MVAGSVALHALEKVSGPVGMDDAKIDPEPGNPHLGDNYPPSFLEPLSHGFLEGSVKTADRPLDGFTRGARASVGKLKKVLQVPDGEIPVEGRFSIFG